MLLPMHPISLTRRHWLANLLLPSGLALAQADAAAPLAPLTRRVLQFPRDLGSHPDTAIEWWYVTGALQAGGRRFGFQLTFFRARVASTQHMKSAFAARQLIFAHAAVTDVAGKRLLHDQRIARSSGVASVDMAFADERDTAVRLRDWSLQRQDQTYLARAGGADFAFALTLIPTQALLLQGDQGLSRKGPQAAQASYYYSVPQLQADGQLTLAGKTLAVRGRAWLDHEWSNTLLHPDAVGWDWIGMNLHDGSALTAFRLRNKAGQALWAGGSWRAPGAGAAQIFAPEEVQMTPVRFWKSTASGATYPVQWTIDIRGAGLPGLRFSVHAVLDDQELDSRQSTGAIYWEGLSDLLNAQAQPVGVGYLEMTGYASPLRLS